MTAWIWSQKPMRHTQLVRDGDLASLSPGFLFCQMGTVIKCWELLMEKPHNRVAGMEPCSVWQFSGEEPREN